MGNNYELPEIKKVIMGTDSELYKQGKGILAIEKILIFPKKEQAIIVDLANLSDEEKAKKINDINNTLKQSDYRLSDDATNLWLNSDKFIKYYNKALKEQNGKNNSALKAALIALGITVGAAGIGGLGYGIYKGLNKDAVSTADELLPVPDISDEEWEFYLENGLDNSQKELFKDRITNWLSLVNGKEDWQKETLTDEDKELYGYKTENCLFGFTASEAYALALRFGNYSDSEYITITGGKAIDVVSVMDDAHSMSNGALSSVIAYYVNSDTCDLQIEKLINFNEQEVAKIKEIEKLFSEYKTLESDEEKTVEAAEKMHEIKVWIEEYANSVDFEQDNAKSYILRTFLPAASIISNTHQYKDTISISLYDKETQSYVDKEIEVELFDEIMMRNLVIGYKENGDSEMFNSESYLEEHGISGEKYQLMMTDVLESVADQSCSSQSQRLVQANTYMAGLSQENALAESVYGSQNNEKVDLKNSNNVITDWDKLVYGTYDSEMLIEKLDEYLVKKELYPENRIYFSTTKISKEQEEYKDTHGITAGEVGDYVKEEPEIQVPVTPNELQQENTIVVNENEEIVPPEQAMEEARQENVEQTGIPDASTPEASEKVEEQVKQSEDFIDRFELLQGVYNATLNHFVGGPIIRDGIDTSNTYGQVYTDAWANSSDADIVFNYNLAVEDANLYNTHLKANGTTYEGEMNVNPEYSEAETHQNEQVPVESTNNQTNDKTDNKVDETQPSITEPTTEENKNQEVEKETETTTEAVDTEKTTVSMDDVNFNEGFDSDIEIEGDIVIEEPTTEAVENNGDTFDGITSEEPSGFSPVVDPVSLENNDAAINLANMSDEELASFLAYIESDIEIETEQQYVKTK